MEPNEGGKKRGTEPNEGRKKRGTELSEGGKKRGTELSEGGKKRGTKHNKGVTKRLMGSNEGGNKRDTKPSEGGMKRLMKNNKGIMKRLMGSTESGSKRNVEFSEGGSKREVESNEGRNKRDTKPSEGGMKRLMKHNKGVMKRLMESDESENKRDMNPTEGVMKRLLDSIESVSKREVEPNEDGNKLEMEPNEAGNKTAMKPTESVMKRLTKPNEGGVKHVVVIEEAVDFFETEHSADELRRLSNENRLKPTKTPHHHIHYSLPPRPHQMQDSYLKSDTDHSAKHVKATHERMSMDTPSNSAKLSSVYHQLNDSFKYMHQRHFSILNEIYFFEVLDSEGHHVSLTKFRGKVILIVNIGSSGQMTFRHYQQLQILQDLYVYAGLRILTFPCKQFCNEKEMKMSDYSFHEFIRDTFGATFFIFARIDVQGKCANPLFIYLQQITDSSISTNFVKYLLDRYGKCYEHYDIGIEPLKLRSDIEYLLNQPFDPRHNSE